MKKSTFRLLFLALPMMLGFASCTVNDNPVDTGVVKVRIDANNFPDEHFRNFLLQQDYGKDGVLTDIEIMNIRAMDLFDMEICSLKGIEYFTALDTLDCSFNDITELDISKNTALVYLDCGLCYLTTLDVSNNTALKHLDCLWNELTALDVSKNTALRYLKCSGNEFEELNVSNNTELTKLFCVESKLTALDVSKNTALKTLDCEDSYLSALDVSNNTALEELTCSDNYLTTLDVTKNVALKGLYCSYNLLTAIALPENSALTTIYCHNNMISGENMDNLINSLPQNTTSEPYEIAIFDSTSSDEQNVCTKAQVAAAKAKGWQPLYWANDYYWWKEYEGSE